MIVPSEVRRAYDFNLPYVEQIERQVRDIVLSHCESHGFAYVGRRKELESLCEKLETGRFNSWNDIDDVFGCSIVIPHLEKERGVIDFLRSRFNCVELRQRGKTKKAPDVFRFDATRFIGRLKFDHGVDPHPALASLSFEIQIRSAFEHAWSVSMHGVAYKTDEVDWKRKRLSAQIKAAVEQLDQLIVSFESAASPIVESPWPETELLKRITDLFSQMGAVRKIPKESVPNSWSRFSESLLQLLRASKSWPRSSADWGPYIDSCLSLIDTRIGNLGDFPRSISLFQLVFGILWEGNHIKPDLYGFVPMVTPELEELFPSVKSCRTRFVFPDLTGRPDHE